MPSFIYLAHFDSDSDVSYIPSEKREIEMSISKKSTSASYRSTKPSKKQRIIHHFKRYWCLHLLAWILTTVLFVCLAIFVIVPVVAQKSVDAATLEIQGIAILNSKPNSFLIQINSTIQTESKVKADLDPFEGNLTLSGVPGAQPFITLKFPQTNANQLQKINISQIVDIANEEAFAQFNRVFYQNRTLKIDISGKTNVKPAGLAKKYPVDFKKTLDLNGLNLLNGTEIQNPKIGFNPDSPNFNATAIITNPSYYTLDIGNATFQSFADGEIVGDLAITNLLLRPGANAIPVTANINQKAILRIVKKPAYCLDGIIPFQLKADKVENKGEDIPWLISSLGSANQTVDVNIGRVIGSPVTDFCIRLL